MRAFFMSKLSLYTIGFVSQNKTDIIFRVIITKRIKEMRKPFNKIQLQRIAILTAIARYKKSQLELNEIPKRKSFFFKGVCQQINTEKTPNQ